MCVCVCVCVCVSAQYNPHYIAIHFNIILTSAPCLPRGLSSSHLPVKFLDVFLTSSSSVSFPHTSSSVI